MDFSTRPSESPNFGYPSISENVSFRSFKFSADTIGEAGSGESLLTAILIIPAATKINSKNVVDVR